jgi:sarcosine oxidase subunit beta
VTDSGMDKNSRPKVVVIGAGIAGLMSAFHTRRLLPDSEITVLDKGRHVPNSFGTSTRSMAATRQQFGCAHNVQMSIFSTRFYERFAERTGETSRMLWQPGYLFLYRTDEDPELGRAKFEDAVARVKLQHDAGLKEAQLMEPRDVAARFPFVNVDKLIGATFCPTDGFLDPGTILSGLKAKLVDLGARICPKTEVVGFDFSGDRVGSVRLESGERVPADFVVNAAGAWSSRIGKMLGTDLPIMPEKRYLWMGKFVDGKRELPVEQFQILPMVVCCANDGLNPHIRPQPGTSQRFMVGCEHPVKPEWDFKDEDQDYVDPAFRPADPDGKFVHIHQELARFLPFAEDLGFDDQVHAGFYESTEAHSPIIGFDPNHSNLVHCCGFSGHGIMHGPAAGDIVAHLIACGRYCTFPDAEANLTYESLIDGTRKIENMKL